MSEEHNYEPSNEALEPIRQRISVNVGNYLQHGDDVYKITQVLDYDSAIGINVATGRSSQLRIKELRPANNAGEESDHTYQDLEEIADSDWAEAEKRYSAIKPLVNELSPGRAVVAERAQ